MAVTLPYPSMNFVPLDILTAQQQNQLVANINFLAGKIEVPVSYAPSDMITLAEGFSFGGSYSNVYKIGKLVIARFQINSTSAYSTTQSIMGTITNAFKGDGIYNGSCVYGGDNSVKEIGYLYVNFAANPRNLYSATAGLSTGSYTKCKFQMIYLLP